jgi:hypothetical protein
MGWEWHAKEASRATIIRGYVFMATMGSSGARNYKHREAERVAAKSGSNVNRQDAEEANFLFRGE